MRLAEPRLILITGIAGAGKSTLGETLAAKLQLTYVDYDTVCQPFLRRLWDRSDHGVSYAQFCLDWREASYGAFWGVVCENLSLGNSVIASAPLSAERGRSTFFSSMKKDINRDFSVLNLHLVPDEQVIRHNLITRGQKRDQEKLVDWDRFYRGQLEIPLTWDADEIIPIRFGRIDDPVGMVLPMILGAGGHQSGGITGRVDDR
jgi:predicted kinase